MENGHDGTGMCMVSGYIGSPPPCSVCMVAKGVPVRSNVLGMQIKVSIHAGNLPREVSIPSLEFAWVHGGEGPKLIEGSTAISRKQHKGAETQLHCTSVYDIIISPFI